PDRSARRPEPPAAPSYPPALPAAGVPDISQERREMGVSSPTASPAAAKRTPSPLPTWSEQETASAASPPPPFASQAEQSLRPPPPSPPAPGQSLRPQVRSNVSAAPSYQYPDAGSVPVSDVFVPDLYLDGGS
ncbi:MAG: hypothetical protein LBT97_08180, partial [Planctomycetota bacterium]|nr:hypothetical protein [Planctomycetota bacterium]